MSSEFAEIIGNYSNITSPSYKKFLGDFLTLMVTKVKDDIMDNEGIDQDHPVYKQFVTFTQATEAKSKTDKKGEKKEKPTYRGMKTTTNKETGEKVTEETDIPLKNFASITVGVKSALVFILNKYVHECKLCYDSMKNFNSVTDVINVVDTYARKEIPDAITPFIRSTISTINIDDTLPNTYLKFNSTLVEKVCTYFKDSKDSYPEKQLIAIAETFMQFLKILACLFTNQIFDKRKPINDEFMLSTLRAMNVYASKSKSSLSFELMQNIRDYIKATKPEKEAKEPSEKKKAPKATKSTKSKAVQNQKEEKDEKDEKEDDDLGDYDEEEEAEQWALDE